MTLTRELVSNLVRDRNVRLQSAVSFGPHPRHVADVWRPAGGEADAVAIFLYGGSWRSGHRSGYTFAGAALASRGITCIVPDYRLFPEVSFPAFVEDAARAYVFVAETIARGRPIVVTGHSAGAYNAALLALDPRYIAALAPAAPRPAGLAGLSGPYSFDPTTWPTTKEIFHTAPHADAARPVAFAGPHAPPALLIHGGADDLVKPKNTHELAAALNAARRPAQVIVHPRLGHIGTLLALARPLRWRAPILPALETFIRSLA